MYVLIVCMVFVFAVNFAIAEIFGEKLLRAFESNASSLLLSGGS